VAGPTVTDRWGDQLAETLREIAWRLSRLADAVAADWPDQRGQEWADRAARLHRELDRQAGAAAELASAGESSAPVTGWSGSSAGRSRVRLGGMEARSADPESGVRIAELPPP
jgi:hypothetical protein